jgi:K+-transporting ATPase ATPase A chain
MMAGGDLLQYGLFQLAAVLLSLPMGRYLERVFRPGPAGLGRLPAALERRILGWMGVDPGRDMDWREQAWAFTTLGLAGAAGLFLLLLAMRWLPGPPAERCLTTPMTWDLALNIAVSFATGTTWQAYAGESTLRHAVQMVGLAAQGFLAGGSGLALGLAFIRGFTRNRHGGLGNFWSDFLRALLWVLLPLAVLLALALVAQGAVMDWRGPVPAVGLEGRAQLLAQGPAAALEAIKNLGCNGGGFFNANGAHPYANPTALANTLGMLAIVAVPGGLVRAFGLMTRRRGAAWALLAVMAALLALAMAGLHGAEAAPPAAFRAAGVEGVNLEGKEVRFGLAQTVIAGAVTAHGACGASAAQVGSFSPLGGGVLLASMLLGEVAFGGIGTGLAGLVMTAVLAVFLAGLMIGRTPEYLGKSLGAKEMRLAVLHLLVIPAVVLPLGALALALPAGRAALGGEPGALRFTAALFAYASCAVNNGQAMGQLAANTPFWNLSTALAMLLGRFAPAFLALALAGSLAGQRRRPASRGSLPAGSPLFAALLLGTVLIVAGLSFLPVLVLGPLAAQLAGG